MNKTCGTCTHESKSMLDEPCNACTQFGPANSQWTPIQMDRAPTPYLTGPGAKPPTCSTCAHRDIEQNAEPCAACNVRDQKRMGPPTFYAYESARGPAPSFLFRAGPLTAQDGPISLDNSDDDLTPSELDIDPLTHPSYGSDMPAAPPTRGEPPASFIRYPFEPTAQPEERRSAPDLLEEAAATYRERNKVYGDNYKSFGIVMAGLFPQGLTCRSPEDFNRLGVLVQCVSKLGRYANQFQHGGHRDSALDLTTYAAMLNELTR